MKFLSSQFEDDVDQETKVKLVENLTKENLSTHDKRYIPSKEELCGPLYFSPQMSYYVANQCFVSRSKQEGFNIEGSEQYS
ncbi:hypothetical protein J437_LFUL016489 [Ladona fulva]|uniref:Uncharacterized protein n=1 Tax=Ladona fulva TaxID=123851 RepID=A0A8K0KJ82_LADFU|nr:hypothetical protein J437_LFUL016489 [Ladona fulva]